MRPHVARRRNLEPDGADDGANVVKFEAMLEASRAEAILRGRRQVVVELKREWARWWRRTRSMEGAAQSQAQQAYLQGRAEMLSEIKAYVRSVSEECLIETQLQLDGAIDEFLGDDRWAEY